MTHPVHVISFVVDEGPKFQIQAWLLLHNLDRLALSPETAILLSHCGRLSPEVQRKAKRHGAWVGQVARFGEGPAAYCNKLQQLDAVLGSGAQQAVLCDTDLGFLSDPCQFAMAGVIRAKPVDHPNPSPQLLRQILDLAGFIEARLDVLPDFALSEHTDRTHALNCNGGLYVLPTDLLRRLAPVWHHWARFCLDQALLLGDRTIHSDQLGFCLAMLDLELPFAPLETEKNFPLHFPAREYANHQSCAPQVLHYHHKIQSDGRIKAPGVAALDAEVARFNALVADARTDPDFIRLLARYHTGGSA
ncbi:hypothetical protein RA2_04465 [Roseovarius sp. A-2]|uniref:hypothetical protein n=1 Tax=Roseovarius sp. A-2 TaxID=1570360 RepID=UPI0009B54C77|nr:hypothetical protein [Roseovarius sp. A-2]GAW37382.1 hypothetical protein RA2_04465 [Roseovarius sp. A-2]